MPDTYSISSISETYTDKDWQEYFRIRTYCAEQKGQPLFFSSWMELKERTLAWLNEGIGVYTISDTNGSAGIFSFKIHLKDDAKRRYVYFRDGLIKDFDPELFDAVYKTFQEYDVLSNALVIKSVNGQYDDFLEKTLQAKIADSRELFELDIAEAKTDLIEQWYNDYSEKFKQYTLQHYEDIPDELLEEYCKVFNQFIGDMPNDSLINDFQINPATIKARQVQNRKQDLCSCRYLVFDGSQLIAKTNVSIHKRHPETMYQYMTGVLEEYRGRGIGTWLKAAMFIKLTEDFPKLKTIKTQIHSKNIGSKQLNLQMGYKNTGLEKEYLIPRH